MNNVLPQDVINRIRALRQDGVSMRKIALELGISKNTVKRYIGDDGALCKCGDAAGHRGWCRVRYAESAARQAFHARRRGVFISVPIKPTVSRVSESTREKGVWLGALPCTCDRLPGSQWLSVIDDVQRATRRIPREVRDDVRHEMIVAVMDGRLPRSDIKRAVVTFLGFIWRGCCIHDPDPRFAALASLDDALSVYAEAEIWAAA